MVSVLAGYVRARIAAMVSACDCAVSVDGVGVGAATVGVAWATGA